MLCRHIGLVLGEKLDTILLHHQIRKYLNSPSTRYWICFFPLWRTDSKVSRFAAKLSGYMWTEVISGKKKLQIQNYPDVFTNGA